jgi:hypothetical protein
MFEDLDATLEAVLTDPAAPAALRAADISFATPDRDYRPGEPTVNLFLHAIAENRRLRDEARVTARSGTRWTARMPSLRVDCTYLVTAWSAGTGGQKTQEEHRLLALALTWLSRFPVVEDTFLRGALKTPPQPYPVPATVAQAEDGATSGHFWSALGIPPRPAFPVTVTIAVEPFDEVDEFAALERFDLRFTSIDRPVLSGRVRDGAAAPVPQATVTVVEGGQQVSTDLRGEFRVPGLQPGAYTLQVQAPGRPQHEQRVTYAADRQVHDVVLPGP